MAYMYLTSYISNAQISTVLHPFGDINTCTCPSNALNVIFNTYRSHMVEMSERMVWKNRILCLFVIFIIVSIIKIDFGVKFCIFALRKHLYIFA